MSSRHSRRRFLGSATAVAAGFMGLRGSVHLLLGDENESSKAGYGPLITDRDGILDLPDGFSYKIVSRKGSPMDDGLFLPGAPDGMGTFPGPYGLTVIVRNHELTPDDTGPFGKDRAELPKVKREKIYDYGEGATPGAGGTTTLVYDTRRKQVVREFMSLCGTIRNCSGGQTPWGSWITCEETVDRAGEIGADDKKYRNEQDHGYCFEVPVTTKVGMAEPVPLKDMGRFYHEAIAVDDKSGVVYETEDLDDGIFYRFLPKTTGKLAQGGQLQALVVKGSPSIDTRNWHRREFEVGDKVNVEWIDLDDVTSPDDDLRKRGYEAGAAMFARAEGIWRGDDGLYFACTSGGTAKKGQIWRYKPSPREGQTDEGNEPGQLELFIEPNDGALIENCDNLTVSPWGDLIVCEDRSGRVVRLVGVTPEGKCYTFAFSHLQTEFAGVVFSPDHSTLFVNAQGEGLTFAITGPWHLKNPAPEAPPLVAS